MYVTSRYYVICDDLCTLQDYFILAKFYLFAFAFGRNLSNALRKVFSVRDQILDQKLREVYFVCSYLANCLSYQQSERQNLRYKVDLNILSFYYTSFFAIAERKIR